MPLKDVLTKPAPRKQKSWLSICEAGLDKEDFDYLISVLKNEEDYSAPYIATIMTKQGYPVTPTTILTARRKING